MFLYIPSTYFNVDVKRIYNCLTLLKVIYIFFFFLNKKTFVMDIKCFKLTISCVEK